MEDNKYELAFKIILFAGDAKSLAMDSINLANRYEFENAEEILQQAQRELKNAHKVQTEMIQNEANGASTDINIILIHSQDHFAMAMTTIEYAKQMIVVLKKVKELEKKIEKLGG